MAGEEDIEKLLALLQPKLQPGEFVFCSVESKQYGDLTELRPLASYQEDEGLSLVINRQAADDAGLTYESVFCCISLTVHSSLEAIGLTAAVAGRLAAYGISANMFAAYYHDHVYVPKDKAELALELLSNI